MTLLYSFFFFFFSSRRRHTRFDCDWSSDVCSSDLSARCVRVVNKAEYPALKALTVSARLRCVFPVPGGPRNTTLVALCTKERSASSHNSRVSEVWLQRKIKGLQGRDRRQTSCGHAPFRCASISSFKFGGK